MAVSRLRPLGGVANRKLRRHSIVRPRFPISVQYILLVWHAQFESCTYFFLIVDYSGISISTARGHLTPDMTSPVDRATTIFYSCFVDIYRLSCTVSTLLALLLLPKMAERRFRPLGGVLDRK
jgi:hypothetical protein